MGYLARALSALTLAAGLALSTPAAAAITTLNFEGLGDANVLGDFYAGGAGGDLGITAGGSVLSSLDTDAGGTGDIANAPSPDTVMHLTGREGWLNFADGFDSGISFYYSSQQSFGLFTLYSGENMTGTLLASFDLPPASNAGCDPGGEAWCNWVQFSTSFSGSAKSVYFWNSAGNGIDNLSVGQTGLPDVGAVPEPGTWAMLILGFGLTGAAIRRRRPTFT